MELIHLLDQAKLERSNIFNYYTEIAGYTMPYTNLYSNNTTISKSGTEIDMTILQSSKDLNNLLMYSMISGDKWATSYLDEDTFYEEKDEAQRTSTEKLEYNDVSKILEKDTSKAFKLIFNSNFTNEVSKALYECQNLGTGCINVIEQNENNNPFIFQFVTIADIFFIEDENSSPNIIFREFKGTKGYILNEMFDLNLEDLAEFDMIESSIKEGDKYIHRLSDQSLTSHIFEEELDYQPYIIFRWNTYNRNSYGLGIGFELLDEFKDLAYYKKLYKDSAELTVYPPLIFTGNIEYMRKLSFESGKVSFGGQSPQETSLNSMNNNSKVIEVEKQIYKLEDNIRNSYVSNPIGDFDTRKNVTAFEIKSRINMFKERFSQTYALLSDELLKATFINVFKLLSVRNILTFDIDYIKMIELKYINEMSKQDNLDQIDKMVQFKGIVGQYFPEYLNLATNDSYMIPEIAKLADLDVEAYKTEKELIEQQERIFKEQEEIGIAEAGVDNENSRDIGTQETIN